jgi:hypothetical protein
LGAQIGVTAILAGAAWLLLLIGGLRPFGRLVNTRGDVLKACCYALLSIGLFAAALSVGMIGA